MEKKSSIIKTTEINLQVDINPTCSRPISLRFDDYENDAVTFFRSQYIRIGAMIEGLDSCHGMMPDVKYNWSIFNKFDKNKKSISMSRMKASGLELVASPSSLAPGIFKGEKIIVINHLEKNSVNMGREKS